MGEYDATLGALLLGAFLNMGFYGVVSTQYVCYYATKFNDPYRVKALVTSLFSLDTVNSASLVYMAWVYGVQNYNNPRALHTPIWPLPFTVLITTITAFLVQTFLTYRIFRLTGSKLRYSVISLLGTMALVVGLICSVFVWKIDSSSEAVRAKTIVTIWLCFEMGVDMVVSGVLSFVLSRSRTQFHKSNTIIDRLIRGSIQSGLFTGIFAMLSLALFLAYPTSHYYAIVAFSSPRIYSITIMDTLLVRHNLRGIIRGNRGSKQIDTSGIWELENLGHFTHSTDESTEPRSRSQAFSNGCTDVFPCDSQFSGGTKYESHESDSEVY